MIILLTIILTSFAVLCDDNFTKRSTKEFKIENNDISPKNIEKREGRALIGHAGHAFLKFTSH